MLRIFNAESSNIAKNQEAWKCFCDFHIKKVYTYVLKTLLKGIVPWKSNSRLYVFLMLQLVKRMKYCFLKVSVNRSLDKYSGIDAFP